MTQDEIIELYEKANGWSPAGYLNTVEELERFAKLVAAHTLSNIDPSKFMSWQEGFEVGVAKEREACAKVCIEHGKVWGERMLFGFQATLDDAAEAIRARGEA